MLSPCDTAFTITVQFQLTPLSDGLVQVGFTRNPVHVRANLTVVVVVSIAGNLTSGFNNRELRGHGGPVALFGFTHDLHRFHRGNQDANQFRIDIVGKVPRNTGVAGSYQRRLGIHRVGVAIRHSVGQIGFSFRKDYTVIPFSHRFML